eukprot:g21859.t1
MKSGHCGFPLFSCGPYVLGLTAVDRSLKPTARLYELQLALFETRQAPQERRRALSSLRLLESSTPNAVNAGNAPWLMGLLRKSGEVLLDSTEHRVVRTEAARTLHELLLALDAARVGLLGEELSAVVRRAVAEEADRYVRRVLVDAATSLCKTFALPSAFEALESLSKDEDSTVRSAAHSAKIELEGGSAAVIEVIWSVQKPPDFGRIILWMLIAAVLFFGLAFFGVMVSWHLLMPMSPQDVETKKLADVVLQLVHDERLGAAKEGRTDLHADGEKIMDLLRSMETKLSPEAAAKLGVEVTATDLARIFGVTSAHGHPMSLEDVKRGAFQGETWFGRLG